MIQCRNCASEVEDGAKYCPKCGTSLLRVIDPDTAIRPAPQPKPFAPIYGIKVLRCIRCGTQAFGGDMFCPRCGESFMPFIQRLKEVYKIQTGLKLRRTFHRGALAMTYIAWSPDGRKLAVACEDMTICIWDTENGQIDQVLGKHTGWVHGIAWSPDGKRLAYGCSDNNVVLWDTETRSQVFHKPMQHSNWVFGVAWSPAGEILASCSKDNTVCLWDSQNRELRWTYRGHSDRVYGVAWSPDGNTLASCSRDSQIHLLDVKTRLRVHLLEGHLDEVYTIAWSPDGKAIASGSADRTVRIWAPQTGQLTDILEGHSGPITGVSFSPDGMLFASKSLDNTVRLWRSDTWEKVAEIPEFTSRILLNIAFHPTGRMLASLGEEDTCIRIWDLNLPELLRGAQVRPPKQSSIHYTNAKIVLLGDTGVGKSGLGLVLIGQPFAPTDSTQGRRVWRFDSKEIDLDGDRKLTRETLLWDLAGQPGYRLIHQLHLNEVAVALVVFDARSETDPLAGVRYWQRALRQAQQLQGNPVQPMKKFLVSARADRGAISLSRDRIEKLVHDLEFDGYFTTSAKEGWGVAELATAIRSAIDWSSLPRVSSTTLFQIIKSFLIQEKETGKLLCSLEDLYRAFVESEAKPLETEDLRAQFDTCVRLLESRDLIQYLSFGNMILLQPELLDMYASAIINAAKEEPDGMGCIVEDDVRMGRFRMSSYERIKDKKQEELLLIATVEDMLRHDLALREDADETAYLVFPSQLTRENPDLPDPEGKAVIFTFDGPVLTIYATLAVRLTHSGVFKKKELWKNAATFTGVAGGFCGVTLREIEEGRGELTLFFDKAASEETRFQFKEYVHTHLKRRALPKSIQIRRIIACNTCGSLVTDQQVRLRNERGFDWLDCSVCSDRVLLVDREERLYVDSVAVIEELDRSANAQRERETAASILQGKVATGDFDVFLCHNSKDKSAVKEIGNRLKRRGILPWLDEWELQPGLRWQKVLEKQIRKIRSAAVFVGSKGIGPWQDMEVDAFLRQFVKRKCPVIPVILADCDRLPRLPTFLEGITWVDFRESDPDPLERLVWGITGERRLDREHGN